MLLVDPPLTLGEWVRTRFQTREFERSLCKYCRVYESAVLSLPPRQLVRVVEYLVRGYQDCEVRPETFHKIVEREMTEDEFEASGKVARLIVLESLADALADQGVALLPRTRRLLTLGRELVPLILLAAIDDHFGVVQIPDENQ